jgi:hypothetical protein
MKKVALLLLALLITVTTANLSYAGGPTPICPIDHPDCIPK